ncbi:hypothetical protein Gpo141_00014800 [Globisporangium polare]
MLRGSPLTAATVAAVRSGANNPQAVLRALEDNSNGGNVVHVVGRRHDNDPVALTLDIYVLEAQQSQEKLTTPPASVRKCSWAALRQLRSELHLAVSNSNSPHCDQCTELSELLKSCFERPTIFNRSWNGVMVLNTSKVAYFVNSLLRLARSMNENNIAASRSSKSREGVLALVSAFLVPGEKKTE